VSQKKAEDWFASQVPKTLQEIEKIQNKDEKSVQLMILQFHTPSGG